MLFDKLLFFFFLYLHTSLRTPRQYIGNFINRDKLFPVPVLPVGRSLVVVYTAIRIHRYINT